MKIEILSNQIGVIGGLRHSWAPNAKNPPDPRFVFEIHKIDFPKLVKFLAGRVVIFGTEEHHEIKFGHTLFLIALDGDGAKNGNKDFFENALS